MELTQDKKIIIDNFVINQNLYNQITANSLFGIERKDHNHLGHDNITWIIDRDIKCLGCNKCDSCQGCAAGCTNAQNCNCNSCQSCVGKNCNSGNGECVGQVHCSPSVMNDPDACLTANQTSNNPCSGSCYMLNNANDSGGRRPSCDGSTGSDTSSPPTLIPTSIASISCACYGCQNTVSGLSSCGNNDGYGGTNTVKVKLSTGDEITLTLEGENVQKAGGSQRGLLELAVRAIGATGGKFKISDSTLIENRDSQGNVTNAATYSAAVPSTVTAHGGSCGQTTVYAVTNVGGTTVYAPTGGNSGAGGWIQPPNSPPICVGLTGAPMP